MATMTKIAGACQRRPQKVGAIERGVGQLLGLNTRAAGLFKVSVEGLAGMGEAKAAIYCVATSLIGVRGALVGLHSTQPKPRPRFEFRRRIWNCGQYAIGGASGWRSTVGDCTETPVPTPATAATITPSISAGLVSRPAHPAAVLPSPWRCTHPSPRPSSHTPDTRSCAPPPAPVPSRPGSGPGGSVPGRHR